MTDIKANALREMYVEQVLALARLYVAACEPRKAQTLIADAPSFLKHHPKLGAFAGWLHARTRQINSETAYTEFYGALGAAQDTYGGAYADAPLLNLPRAQMLLQFLRARPQTKTVLAVGTGDGTLERAILQEHPQITLYCSDLSPETDIGVQALLKEFPERVKIAPVLGFASTLPESIPQVDVVYAYEVLEHVIDPGRFVKHLVAAAGHDGDILISTPNGLDWVEFYHLDDKEGPGNAQHVRSITAGDLRDWFAAENAFGVVTCFGGDLLGLFHPSRISGINPIPTKEVLAEGGSVGQAIGGLPRVVDLFVPGRVTDPNGAEVLSANGRVFYPKAYYTP